MAGLLVFEPAFGLVETENALEQAEVGCSDDFAKVQAGCFSLTTSMPKFLGVLSNFLLRAMAMLLGRQSVDEK